MKDFIAYCGLDCETCEARLATINNDNELRETVYDYSHSPDALKNLHGN